eukprot:scaffold6601_cov72-Isochrysis_galbana.AAC.2
MEVSFECREENSPLHLCCVWPPRRAGVRRRWRLCCPERQSTRRFRLCRCLGMLPAGAPADCTRRGSAAGGMRPWMRPWMRPGMRPGMRPWMRPRWLVRAWPARPVPSWHAEAS